MGIFRLSFKVFVLRLRSGIIRKHWEQTTHLLFHESVAELQRTIWRDCQGGWVLMPTVQRDMGAFVFGDNLYLTAHSQRLWALDGPAWAGVCIWWIQRCLQTQLFCNLEALWERGKQILAVVMKRSVMPFQAQRWEHCNYPASWNKGGTVGAPKWTAVLQENSVLHTKCNTCRFLDACVDLVLLGTGSTVIH